MPTTLPAMDALSLADRWILSRLSRAIRAVENALDTFRFDLASQAAYDFIWGEFCDWYIEMAKILLRSGDKDERQRVQQTLLRVLEGSLCLLHPLMPFVTEALWQRLPWPEGGRPAPALIVAPWPEAPPPDPQAEAQVGLLIGLVRAIRTARAEHAVKPGRRIAAQIAAGDQCALLTAHRHLLVGLARLDPAQLRIAEALPAPTERTIVLSVAGIEICLPLAGAVAPEAEGQRLEAELAQAEVQIARSRQLLSNESFLTKAPPPVVARARSKLADLEEQAAKIQQRLERLKTA